MTKLLSALGHFARAIAAAMMALMFLTFVLQIAVRYSARLEWVPEQFPFLEPSLYGWTLEFCLLLWVWLIFWGNAFIVRDQDHVTFDILFLAVRPAVRRWFIIVSGLAITVGLALSIEPTWSKFYILRLKKTATLSSVFGDWIRMRDIYAVYILFLVAVSLRYAWAVYRAARHGVEAPTPKSVGDAQK
ncbi:TRAP transporter small permease [Roseobacter sp. YSTF-M11]|uniref:TRAP transporter small permease protein n=1 Tax=Roseobacter insulae TaxID=2859783 RepID=A0A9X1FUL8_9RHOB|nr:TRAP transporter small permease subunit [Roseobacter insulae]MBW4707410.1 TRAP transporter small permease [Roseobacter insulae]